MTNPTAFDFSSGGNAPINLHRRTQKWPGENHGSERKQAGSECCQIVFAFLTVVCRLKGSPLRSHAHGEGGSRHTRGAPRIGQRQGGRSSTPSKVGRVHIGHEQGRPRNRALGRQQYTRMQEALPKPCSWEGSLGTVFYGAKIHFGMEAKVVMESEPCITCIIRIDSSSHKLQQMQKAAAGTCIVLIDLKGQGYIQAKKQRSTKQKLLVWKIKHESIPFEFPLGRTNNTG